MAHHMAMDGDGVKRGMQEHMRQQIATIIKHTAVPAPWPIAIESPLFNGGHRTSGTSVSSRHYMTNPVEGVHLQVPRRVRVDCPA